MNAEELKAHVLGRDFASDARACIRTNHLGYMPAAPKFAVLEGDGLPEELEFCLVACASGRTALRQRLYAQQGDFGRAMVFDFSQVREQGSYYVSAGGFRSYPIRIGMNVLDEVVSAPVEYFAAQRCGPSETGYLSPCHLEVGIRSDNGQHQDVSGGWHDASDPAQMGERHHRRHGGAGQGVRALRGRGAARGHLGGAAMGQPLLPAYAGTPRAM